METKRKSDSELRCYEVYDHLARNAARLLDPDFLASFLDPHCTNKVAGMRGSRLRIVQIPWEFARFLVFMAERSVATYFELGTSTGGSWFMADSYVRAQNPSFCRSKGCDRTSKLRDWDEYHARFPSTQFICCNSRSLELDESFDMTFIDATHKEHWVWHDFNKVKANSRFVAFHDIALQGATVYRFWEAVRNQYPSWEIIDRSRPKTCGIGIVQVNG